MGEWFDFILCLVALGLAFYVVHNIFSKNTKEFHCSIKPDELKFDSTFYEDKY